MAGPFGDHADGGQLSQAAEGVSAAGAQDTARAARADARNLNEFLVRGSVRLEGEAVPMPQRPDQLGVHGKRQVIVVVESQLLGRDAVEAG